MILLITKDLFFVPVVRSAAEPHGLEVVVAKDLEDSRLESVETSDIGLAIVDLGAIRLAELPSIHEQLVGFSPRIVTSAFGSHVHENRLQTARECGFSTVLTKGQFSNQLPKLLAGLAPE